jgi:uncharacterized RDD family membrane protein YckC
MPNRIVINGKEVTNPLAKAVIGALAVLLAGAIAAVVIFLVLPLVGIVLTFTVAIVGVVLVALGIGIPLITFGGAILGALLAPFAALGARKKSRGRHARDN